MKTYTIVLLSLSFIVCGDSLAETPQPTVSGRTETLYDTLSFSILPYSGEQEFQAFGVDLHTKKLLAVEVQIEKADGDDRTFAVRRHDLQMVFADGQTRYALDPKKLYERTRVYVSGGVLLLGLIGGAVAMHDDSTRDRELSDAAIDEEVLDPDNGVIHGFVFFDISGLQDDTPRRLKIEYEDLEDFDVDTATIELAP